MRLPDASSGPLVRRLLYLSEPMRSVADGGVLAALAPLLALAPKGDGHPVLVLPGLYANDTSTTALRGFVRWLGYPVTGWNLGRNHGPTRAVVEGLPRLLESITDRHGERVSIVGWSLGGIFARRLALRSPDRVRQVITLGSPFRARPENLGRSPGERAYRRLAHRHVSERPDPADQPGETELPVPSTAVFSRWDGIVDYRKCQQSPGHHTESVEVNASHLGFGHHPAVLWIVADRLAQAPDQWQPFLPAQGAAARLLFTATRQVRQGGQTWTG